MSVFHENMLVGSSGQGGAPGAYQVERSLRFNSADSAYLSRTPASAGNRKTWTWSGWVKRSKLGVGQRFWSGGSGTSDTGYFSVEFTSGDIISIAGYSTFFRNTTAVYRDPSAWMHILVAVDTTLSTANDRIRLYVNGVEVTAFSTNNAFTKDNDTGVNSAQLHLIGGNPFNSLETPSLYLAECYLIDGQALTPSSFTEVSATTGQLVPKAYTGTYGTNGFYLKFADNSGTTSTTLGKDSSPNGNNWTPNNFSVTAGAGNDSLVDTPTSYGTDTGAGGEVRGNYCTLNPLNAAHTYSNGNLDLTASTTSHASIPPAVGSIGISSGKWYFEFTPTSITSNPLIGITAVPATDRYPGYSASSYGYYASDGNKYNNSSASAYGNSWAANDVIGIAFDLDAGKLWFSKNGTWQASGNPASGTNAAFTSIPAGVYFPAVHKDTTGSGTFSGVFNFGQRSWAYAAPAGFKALCDTNLPAPVVAKPSTVFDVKTYSGNGGTQSITGLAFSPDLVWYKSRNNVGNNALFDSVRGATKRLVSNDTAAEDTRSGVTSFDSTGWTEGSFDNQSGYTYAAWAWDAGTSTVTNTAGSITSSVRANASAGFSVVTFTKTGGSSTSVTVGHGLGAEPHMIIVKNRNTADDWYVYTKALGNTKRVQLNSTSAEVTGTNVWGSTTPTSTVFTVRALFDDPHVAYCFAPVAGYSNGFSYTGNGSSDGPMVYLGFRPRFIIQKRTDSAGSWLLIDTARDPFNVARNELFANSSAAEFDNTSLLDVLSNGFKIRATFANMNASGGSFIGFAFAENPFQYARAR